MDPLTITAGIIGCVEPALQLVRRLFHDLDGTVNASEPVKLLRGDVDSLQASLSLLKDIDAPVWASLGREVREQSATAIQSCDSACDKFRGDLQRWTKRSKDGSLCWRDRVSIGFFKEHQLKALSSRLQHYKLSFNSVVATANLYSSLRNAKLTEEVRKEIIEQHDSMQATCDDITNERAVAAQSLIDIETNEGGLIPVGEDDADAKEATIASVEDLAHTLALSQKLLDGLIEKAKVVEVVEKTQSTRITFGNNHSGMQTGINQGHITWEPKK